MTSLAERLRAAYTNGPIDPIAPEMAPGDQRAAYAVQEENTEHWLRTGRRLVGRKIGLTSPAVQRQLGVDQPDSGMLFADMTVDEGGVIPAGQLLQPKVEAEIAFMVGRDLTQEQPSSAEVLRAIDAVLPAIEIVDSRIAGWRISITDTIADNASSGMFVLGPTMHRLEGLDLRLCGMVLERAGEPVSFGAGAACLGHPLNAVRWLAARMVELGRPLQSGDTVLSGALGPMYDAVAGDRFEAHLSGLGSVRVGFG